MFPYSLLFIFTHRNSSVLLGQIFSEMIETCSFYIYTEIYDNDLKPLRRRIIISNIILKTKSRKTLNVLNFKH